ncbi:MAG: Uma2 family endonuclease [Bacteroidota bacterium]
MQELKKKLISIAEYHEIEQESGLKYEYHQGEIFAMAGGEPEHSLIATNISTILNTKLQGKGCIVGNSDLKVRLDDQDRTFYPDISIFCEPPIRSSKESIALTNPSMLVEVVSDTPKHTIEETSLTTTAEFLRLNVI